VQTIPLENGALNSFVGCTSLIVAIGSLTLTSFATNKHPLSRAITGQPVSRRADGGIIQVPPAVRIDSKNTSKLEKKETDTWMLGWFVLSSMALEDVVSLSLSMIPELPMRRVSPIGWPLRLMPFLLLPLVIGCSRGTEGGGGREFISVGTAPVGGVFYTVGSAICEVVNEQKSDANWRVSAEATGGSMENIRLLSQGKMQFAMSNSSITYFAVRGEGDWEQQHDVRAVMTLFPNVAMFVALKGSGINNIAELKGKRVFIGPEGAGFEYFVNPILEAHGLTMADIQPRYGSQQSAVDLLGDNAVEAAMIGGGIPNPSLSQMAQANPVKLIPYDPEAKAKLIEKYSFFEPATIPGGTYSGLPDDQPSLNVGSAHLITHASVADDLVYEFTKQVYEHRKLIAQRHRAAAAITPESVATENGTEFHPGAIRFYQEQGIWTETVSHE